MTQAPHGVVTHSFQQALVGSGSRNMVVLFHRQGTGDAESLSNLQVRRGGSKSAFLTVLDSDHCTLYIKTSLCLVIVNAFGPQYLGIGD